MDSQDYLNQIAASSRPYKPPKKGLAGILTSKYFKWGGIALIALTVIVIFGSMLGGGKSTVLDKCIDLKLHLDATTGVIDTYQPNVKSSQLRSLSSSMKGLFTNVSSQLNTYMVQALGYDEKEVKETVIEEVVLARDELLNDLFEAKINGFLDRVYAHKMTLEIYNVISQEKGVIDATEDANLKSYLASSIDSLNNLYTQFNDFSETNNK